MEINSVTNIQNIQKKYKFYWSVYSRKTAGAGMVFAIAGLIFIVYGFFDRTATIRGINLFVSVGAGFVITSFFSFYGLVNSRNTFFAKVDKLINDCPDFSYTYRADDQGLEYTEYGANTRVSWNRFSTYCDLEDYLCLLINNSLNTSFIINKTELSEVEMNNLTTLIKTKLPATAPQDLGSTVR